MRNSTIASVPIGLTMLSAFTLAGVSRADDRPSTPSPTPAAATPAAAPKMPADLPRRVQEITDAVLDHHINPPARQQMILSGIRSLYRAAGVPLPAGLGRRVSSAITSEQMAALLGDIWPRSTGKSIAADEIEEAFLDGLLAVVPGGAYLQSVKETKVAQQIAGNRYVGIHIALGIDEKAKQPVMSGVFEGGPADRAGVKKGDLLEQVDGVATQGMKLRDVVDRLRGDEGTKVTIVVRNPGETRSRTMTLTRGQLPQPTIEGVRKRSPGEWTFKLDGPDPIGYLRIVEMSASTPHELRALARRLEDEGIRGLIIDLRMPHDRGGSVHPAVLLADCLLEGGTIGRVRTARGETTYRAEADALFRGWPVAVLVDQATSGSAEWLAAALQDNHRAVLVGQATRGAVGQRPGEALVRSTVPVGDGRTSIVMATGLYERGDGRPLADDEGDMLGAPPAQKLRKGGVRPDHTIPAPRHPAAASQTSDVRQAASAEQLTDPALTAAVQVLRQALSRLGP